MTLGQKVPNPKCASEGEFGSEDIQSRLTSKQTPCKEPECQALLVSEASPDRTLREPIDSRFLALSRSGTLWREVGELCWFTSLFSHLLQTQSYLSHVTGTGLANWCSAAAPLPQGHEARKPSPGTWLLRRQMEMCKGSGLLDITPTTESSCSLALPPTPGTYFLAPDFFNQSSRHSLYSAVSGTHLPPLSKPEILNSLSFSKNSLKTKPFSKSVHPFFLFKNSTLETIKKHVKFSA